MPPSGHVKTSAPLSVVKMTIVLSATPFSKAASGSSVGRARSSQVRWRTGIFSGLDWLPTLSAAAGNPDITDQLLKGVKLGDQTYKNHLDGYNQLDLFLGKAPSARHELFYFGGPKLGAIRIDEKFQFYQQPYGWPGEKVTTDMPTIVNLRQDPFERTPRPVAKP
jgi:arylsulfatase A-like enzyme